VSHPLAEFRIVGERLLQQAQLALPTLLQHARPNAFLQHQHALLPQLVQRLGLAAAPRERGAAAGNVVLLRSDPELDGRLLASLLYEHTSRPFADAVAAVKALSSGQQRALLDELMQKRGAHDAWPMGFEGGWPFEFEVLLDFGAFRDVGRHRKGFQQQQALTTAHGFVVPPLLEDSGLHGRYREVLERAAERQRRIAERFPLAAGYVTPFAFLQRVRIVFDARQLAYFIELRSGPEGHFAYRKVALDMFAELQRVSPLFAAFVRAQHGSAFLGRMESEQSADERQKRRMQAAGDA
jgi:hypothetical protein